MVAAGEPRPVISSRTDATAAAAADASTAGVRAETRTNQMLATNIRPVTRRVH